MTDSMVVGLVRETAHAVTYARLYGQKPEDGSEIGRNEAWARMTVADVFEAIDIVFGSREVPCSGGRKS